MILPDFPNLDRSDSEESSSAAAPATATAASSEAGTANTAPREEDPDDHNADRDKSPRAPVRIMSISSDTSSIDFGPPMSSMEDDLGYEDAAPEIQRKNAELESISRSSKIHHYDGTRVPRRSSLKFSDTSNGAGASAAADGTTATTSSSSSSRNVSRRASMGCASTTIVEVRIRGQRFPVQRRRSIDFDTAVEVKEVEKVTEIDPDTSASQIWLQPEDFAQMKLDRRAVVQKHKQAGTNSTSTGTSKEFAEEEDIRGLEKYLDRSGRILKNRAWDTVLLEQDEQELNGEFNDERIAHLYKSTTYQSPEKAAEKGQQDEEAVRDYLMTPRTTKLMMRRLSC